MSWLPSDVDQRFDALVSPEPMTGCWLWTGAFVGRGYGRLERGYRYIQAHRYAWEQIRGPIPSGLNVCHRCDNPACVNPDHLFLGSQSENMTDCLRKGRLGGFVVPKLDERTIAKVRAEYVRGVSQRALAKRYGVHNSTLSRSLARPARSAA